jgi:hypothetical protein
MPASLRLPMTDLPMRWKRETVEPECVQVVRAGGQHAATAFGRADGRRERLRRVLSGACTAMRQAAGGRRSNRRGRFSGLSFSRFPSSLEINGNTCDIDSKSKTGRNWHINEERWNDGQEVERVDAAQRGKRGSDRSNTIWKRGGDDSTPRGDHREVRYMDAEGDAREGERTKAETRPVFYWRRRAPAAVAWCDENRCRSAWLTETLRPRPTDCWARRRNDVRFE